MSAEGDTGSRVEELTSRDYGEAGQMASATFALDLLMSLLLLEGAVHI